MDHQENIIDTIDQVKAANEPSEPHQSLQDINSVPDLHNEMKSVHQNTDEIHETGRFKTDEHMTLEKVATQVAGGASIVVLGDATQNLEDASRQ